MGNYFIGKLFAVGVFACGIGYAFTGRNSFSETAIAFAFVSVFTFFIEGLVRGA